MSSQPPTVNQKIKISRYNKRDHTAKQMYQRKLSEVEKRVKKDILAREITPHEYLNSDPVFLAVYKNDLKSLQEYIGSTKDLNVKNNAGMGLLEFALRCESSACVLELLKTQDIIFTEAYQGNTYKIKEYIEENRDVNACHDGLSLMEIAIIGKQNLVVEQLMDSGAKLPIREVPIKKYKGKKAPSESINDPNFVLEAADVERFEVYCLQGIIDKVILYLLKGMDPNIPSIFTSSIANGYSGVAKVLLHYGADINTIDPNGQSALIIAIVTKQIKFAEYLIAQGIDCSMRLSDKGNKCNALDFAAQSGETGIVELLLKKRMDVNQTNKLGETPICFSISHAHYETTVFLYTNGAKIDFIDNNGMSALMHSCNQKFETQDIVKFILKIHHDKKLNLLDLQTKKGFTAMMMATFYGHLESFKAILEAGASLWIEDNNKKTALHWACEKGKAGIVAFILSSGLKAQAPKVPITDHRSKEGLTALEYAIKMHHIPVIKLFFSMGYGTTESLSIAIDSGSPDVFSCIVDEIGSEKICANLWFKALDRACQFNDSRLVKIILEHLKEVEISKLLPKLLQRMSELKHDDIIRILLEHKIRILSNEFSKKRTEQKEILEYLNQFIAIASDLLSKLQNGFTDNGDIIIPLQNLIQFIRIDSAYLLKESDDTLILLSSENIVSILEKMFQRKIKNNEEFNGNAILKCIWDDSNLKQILKDEQDKNKREMELSKLMDVYINIPIRFRGQAYKQVIDEISPVNVINIILEHCDIVETNIKRSNDNLGKMIFKSGKEKKKEHALAKNKEVSDEVDKIRTEVIYTQSEMNNLHLNFIKRYDALHKKIIAAYQAKNTKLLAHFINLLNVMLDQFNVLFEKLKEHKNTIMSISHRLEEQIDREVRGITANWKVEQKLSQEAIEAERLREFRRKSEQLKRKQNDVQAKTLETLREERHKQWEAQRDAQKLAQKEAQSHSNLSNRSAQRIKSFIPSEFCSNKELAQRYLKKPPLVFSFDIFNKLMLTKTKEYKLLHEILAMNLKNPNISDLLVERNALLGTFAQLMEKNKKANHLLFSNYMANKIRNVIFHTEILFPNFYDLENSLKINKDIRDTLLKILHYIAMASKKSILQTESDEIVQKKIDSELLNKIMDHQLKESKLLGCLLQLSAGDKELEDYKKTSHHFQDRIKKAAIGYTYSRLGTFACDIKKDHEKEMTPDLFKECMLKYEKYIPLGCDYRHLKNSVRLNLHSDLAIQKKPITYVTPQLTITYVHLPSLEVEDYSSKKSSTVRI